jgi:site-specific recombinase XerD
MTTPFVPAAGLVQSFFVEHLLNQKHASPRTLAAYRDVFRLLLRFVRDTQGVEPAVLTVDNLDAPVILAFLDHIERQRANSIRSRNARLAAIRSFFRFVQMRGGSYSSCLTRAGYSGKAYGAQADRLSHTPRN